MRYSKELVNVARKHYNISDKIAERFPIQFLAICISESNAAETGRKKPPGLEFYTTLEIAEIIKDKDRGY